MYKTRLQKELKTLNENVAQNGLRVSTYGDERPREIEVEFDGPEGSLYQGEKYRLYFGFTERYPLESPVVYFQHPSPPHPHIFTNGHICLSILGTGWSPALTIEKVCLSIQSMLASSPRREIPEGDAEYVKRHPRGTNPKLTSWVYEDDTC